MVGLLLARLNTVALRTRRIERVFSILLSSRKPPRAERRRLEREASKRGRRRFRLSSIPPWLAAIAGLFMAVIAGIMFFFYTMGSSPPPVFGIEVNTLTSLTSTSCNISIVNQAHEPVENIVLTGPSPGRIGGVYVRQADYKDHLPESFHRFKVTTVVLLFPGEKIDVSWETSLFCPFAEQIELRQP